jgi:hypothetical protein
MTSRRADPRDRRLSSPPPVPPFWTVPPIAVNARTATGLEGRCDVCRWRVLRGDRIADIGGKPAHLPCIAESTS